MESRRVSVADDVELAVYDWGGTGTSFLLLHGLASNARMWDGVARRLVAAGHRAVAVDLRGHGRSSKPDDGYSTNQVAADVAVLTERLGLDRPIVAGQSWGGNIVIELAAAHPESTRGVVPVDGGFFHLHDRFPAWDDCAAAMSPPRLIGTPVKRMEAAMRNANKLWPAEGIAGSLANFEVRDDGTIAPWLTLERHLQVLRGLWEHRPRERYASIHRPVLWMPVETPGQPVESKRTNIAEAERLLARSRTVWFSPAHHDVHAEQPEAVVNALLAALADGFFDDEGRTP